MTPLQKQALKKIRTLVEGMHLELPVILQSDDQVAMDLKKHKMKCNTEDEESRSEILEWIRSMEKS